jgi:hypothetical protein
MHDLYPLNCDKNFCELWWNTYIIQGRIQDFNLGGGGALKKIAPSGGRGEHILGISCEKSRFYAKKSYFFPILGGGAPPPPPWIRPCIIPPLLDMQCIYDWKLQFLTM